MSKAAELAALIGSQSALSDRNIIINGAMNVAQRGTSSAVTTSSGYFTVDRFRTTVTSDSAGRLTQSQATITDLPGFANAIKLDCTTADTSLAAGEILVLATRFEGQDLQQLQKGTSSAKPVTVSFYAKGTAKTYMCELLDNDNSRHNTQQFTVSTSWTRHSITFVGDTTGALDDDNALSFILSFWLHAGSTYSGGTYTANTWATNTAANRAAGIDSFFSSTDNELFITGVQMELGEQATPFQHEDISTTIAKCQRYFFREGNVGEALHYVTTGPVGGQRWYFQALPVQMRADPTDTIYAAGSQTQSGKLAKDDGTFVDVSGSYTSQDTLGLLLSGQDNTHNFFFFDFDVDAEL
tara:strand:+ start:379 stop:1440 length:1062 start_codon:yes stop_codon:yes gene_type:complete